MRKTSFAISFAAIIALFFMWGFITCMNDILIPQLKEMFHLSRAGSMFVEFCFFGAYFVGSLIYFIVSVVSGDPINRIGYKKGIVSGLLLSAVGCLLFYPASILMLYPLFLAGLFIIGLGVTILQIAANPYVTILGAPEGASGRLNLSQAFNSLGTVLAPMLGGLLLAKLGDAAHIHIPYLIFCGMFLLVALVIVLVPLPYFQNEEKIERGGSALKDPTLLLGIAAIFCYVGAEVSVGSSFISCAKELIPSMSEQEQSARNYLAFYWGGLMIGRFLGSLSLIQYRNSFFKYGLMTVVALLTFGVLMGINYILHPDTFVPKDMLPYLLFIGLNILAFMVGRSQSMRIIGIFAGVNIIFLVAAMAVSGYSTLWFLVGTGLFNSVMWANIFSGAIANLGKYKSQGSSLLVMAILGGAILPQIQAWVADLLGGYHYSFFIPVLAYSYLIFFGFKAHKLAGN
ncbi:MAG: sugar MFS transporter [Bacteroidales bacterium]|nr:sugar MFS transporter [Bacteroidales bacterium]